MSKVKRFSLEERYGYQNRKVIYDKKSDNDIELNNIYPIIDLFNQLNEQIADLEAKLEEYKKFMKDNEWDSVEEMQETLNKCEKKYFDIQQELAGRKKLCDLRYKQLQNSHQDKISFAIAELEKVKENIHYLLSFDYNLLSKVNEQFDNQIKQAKEMK